MTPAKANLPESRLDLDAHVPPETPANLDLAAMGEPIQAHAPPPLVNQPDPSTAPSEKHEKQPSTTGLPDHQDT
jgi:hypothetical protein